MNDAFSYIAAANDRAPPARHLQVDNPMRLASGKRSRMETSSNSSAAAVLNRAGENHFAATHLIKLVRVRLERYGLIDLYSLL